ncbi:MAG: hypothetical protein Q9178_005970 [Gyalolechia marmorata]
MLSVRREVNLPQALLRGVLVLLLHSDFLSPEHSSNFEPIHSNNIVTYTTRKEKPSQNLTEQKPPNKQRKTRRRCVSPSQLLLVDPINATAKLNDATSHRTPAQNQLSELKHKIRLSKNRDINPSEFKFPPMTPPATRRTTWKLGSGFQRRRKRRPLTGGRSPLNREEARRQTNLEKRAPRIQSANHMSSTPGIEAEKIPLDDKTGQSKKPQPTISKHTSGE